MTENQSARPSPALVQRHLHGMDYPASRDDLVNYARRECEGGNYPRGECERVLQVLSLLPDREYQRPVDVSKAFGEVARGYLQNASYPARRDDLVASARDQGADQIVLDTIVLIPDEEYPDVDAVIVQIIDAELRLSAAGYSATGGTPSPPHSPPPTRRADGQRARTGPMPLVPLLIPVTKMAHV